MTYDEFQRQLGKAGLNNRKFAEIIKMNRNSITNFSKRGEVPSHLAIISVLIGELKEHKIDFEVLINNVGIKPKKPRGSVSGCEFGRNKLDVS